VVLVVGFQVQRVEETVVSICIGLNQLVYRLEDPPVFPLGLPSLP
jgi:hypothetical protein